MTKAFKLDHIAIAEIGFLFNYETILIVSSFILTTHFAKIFVLPFILALIAAAAPVPSPEGNMATRNVRCCHGAIQRFMRQACRLHSGSSSPSPDMKVSPDVVL
ncbi:hypothetical protein FRC18_011448 [Serendipita sp. 400]|nr:hypothetical protein FRC18_011448 [Serendipita sp. 400]